MRMHGQTKLGFYPLPVAVAPHKLKISGDLTIHGVTKQVVLEVDGPSDAIKDPMGNFRRGANATIRSTAPILALRQCAE